MSVLKNEAGSRAWKTKRVEQIRSLPLLRAIPKYEREINEAAALLGVSAPSFFLTCKVPDFQEEELAGCTLRRHLDLPSGADVPYDTERLPNGRFRFGATPDPGLQIALGGSDTLSLCVIGKGPQGCGIQPLRHLSREEWIHMLGGARDATLAEILVEERSLDHAGTRIHCAIQAARRAGIEETFKLYFEARKGDTVLFSMQGNGRKFQVLTFPIGDATEGYQMVAILVDARSKSRRAVQGLKAA